jgi:hypothetical protein
VLPLDETETLDGANPRRAGGRLDPPQVAARQAAMVRRALRAGPVVVLVLGGAHDLSAEGRRQTGGRGEYLRVTAEGYPGQTGR